MSGAETAVRVYVFGDQTYNYERALSQLLSSDNAHLTWFFRVCYDALRKELGRLPPHAADVTPKFSSISDLVTRKRDGTLSPALEPVLSLIHNLAAFIWGHSSGNQPFPTARTTHLLGFCTGALAAAAVSSSQNLEELISAGTYAVIVALHTGLRSSQAAQSTSGSTRPSSWSLVIHDAGEELSTSLEAFNTSKKPRPASSYAYISSVSSTNSTISAPPDVLKTLAHDTVFVKRRKANLPIHSPFHARHLFTGEDVSNIMQKAESWACNKNDKPIPVISCGTAHAIWVADSRAMMESAVQDMLMRPMLVDKTIEALCATLQIADCSRISINAIGTELGGAVKRRIESTIPSVDIELDLPKEVPTTNNPTGRSKIAIIGMAGRFPGASNADDLWQLLQDRVDMVREVPEFRWDPKTHVDPTGKAKNTSKVRWGCWLDDPDLFDAAFFSISPREAPQVDPAQRLALMTAYEALEQAGVVPGRTPSTREDRVGVFYGVTSNDWCEANSGQDIDTYYIPGANRAFIPGRVNYYFKFSGPSYATDTACSSSLSAIHIACNSLWQRDIDMAIAGGTNVLTNPDMTTGLDKGHFLSETGNCKTFDETADGYCRGEGVATIVLKRLEDAVEDSDPILGVIDSAFTNHSAEAESITRPHVGAQKDIFERVLSSAGISPYDVSYIEMHGTGTQAGDLREINSVCDTFAPANKPHARPAETPLHLGALKANIGHGESVSGVSALMKVIMMMRKGQIPPHCGIKTRLNPNFPQDLTARHVHIDLEPTAWPRAGGQPRKALINNFSAAGGNTSVLIEEPPENTQHDCHDSAALLEIRKVFPVTVSARSAKSLQANTKSLLDYVSKADVSLPSLSYTTTARRVHHHFRFTMVCDGVAQLKTKLQGALESSLSSQRIRPPKQMLLSFTGQGSQYPGMGKDLLESLGVFRDEMVHFDSLARGLGFPGFISLLRGSGGSDIAAYPPVVVQLANTCMQIALARIWISWGITPTAVVGHSLGEYAALNVAGVLSDADTVFLVGRRAQLLQELCEPGSHAMLAVAASVDSLKTSLKGVDFETACINGPQETVLAGRKGQVEQWKKTLSAAGIRNTLLQVPYAFHTSQIDPICKVFKENAEGVVFRAPKIAVLSPLHGSVVQPGDSSVFGPEYVVQHARQPVQMMKALKSASQAQVLSDASYGIEFGPHPVVSGMIKSTLGDKLTVLPTLRNKASSWSILAQTLSTLHDAGLPLRWDGYFADIPAAHMVLELPSYSWDLRSYWIKYRNDFTLTKGDIPIEKARSGASVTEQVELLPATSTATKASKSKDAGANKLESSSIQKVLEEKVTDDGYTVQIECDTAREDVKPFIQSHTVDGYSLCTPAVYADISFTLGNHVLDRFNPPFAGRIVTVNNMDIKRALIGSADWKQLLRCEAKFSWTKQEGEVSFTVHDGNGKEVGQLATCQIRFIDESARRSLAQSIPTIQGHFDRMRRHLADGKTSRISGDMAYRIVSELADFNPDYHCVDDVLYDNDAYESACRVSFGKMKKGGDFFINPGTVDGLTQSAGFTMNANEKTKLATDVFVNHGWKEFQLFEKIRDDCQYSTHVQMSPAGGEEGLWAGDISIFTADTPVALVKGVQIQGVQRRFLKYILSQAAKPPKWIAKGNKASDTASAAKAEPKKSSTPSAPTAAPTPPAPQKTEQKAATDDGVAKKALEIIAEQSGVEVSELKDDTCFSDLGVDSLLSLMIMSQFSEDLGVNADPNFFEENTTIADVKKFFLGEASGDAEPQPEQAVKAAEEPAPTPKNTQPRPATAPAPASSGMDDETNAKFNEALKVISEETEVPLGDLKDDTHIADLGVDSLLSLMIGSRFRDELDIDFDTQELLNSLETIGALRGAMFPNSTSSSSDSGDDSDSSGVMISTPSTQTPPSEADSIKPEDEDVPPTTSVVLQGNSKSAKNILWFFPDGSGLASSYVNLPRIRDDLVVYGMNSPYLKKGVEMNCSWDAMVLSYMKEIRRRQPHGPYSFAGWSAGGILAYRASQMLMNDGENVRDLIILDSPPPFKLKLLPEHFFEYCSTAGLLGGNGKAPDWLINHFRSINKVLQSYSATPLGRSTLRKVNILWACESSVDDSFYGASDDPEDMKFLTVKRKDYSAGAWGPLFKDVPVKIDLAEGQHHWSLLKGDSAPKVAEYIRNILAE